jgi:hypothetical protein
VRGGGRRPGTCADPSLKLGGDSYDRVVQGPADRVLADRYTGEPEDDGGGGAGGAAVDPPDADPPQPVFPMDPWLAPDSALQRCLDQVRDTKKGRTTPYKALRFAIVDLTGDVTHPRYAAVAGEKETSIDSMAKLGVFVAAYLLRDQVRTAAALLPDEKKEKVLKRINAAWKPYWETRVDGRPKDSPKIEKIFEINLGGPEHWQVRFQWEPKGEDTMNDLGHSSAAAQADFRSRLELMMRWSSNEAASACITDLGFQAINSLLADAGFFEMNQGGGLWLSKLYAKDGFWGRRDPAGGGTVHGGTARAVAEVLTLMAQDRLVRPGVAAEMRRIMSAGQEHGYGSWIVNAIGAADDPGVAAGATPAKRKVDRFVAKVGLYGDRLSDCALIDRTTADDQALQYIMVVLNCPDEATMNEISVLLDDCVLAQHPPPPPQPAPNP